MSSCQLQDRVVNVDHSAPQFNRLANGLGQIENSLLERWWGGERCAQNGVHRLFRKLVYTELDEVLSSSFLIIACKLF
jgi:hypothetical protein